MSEKKLLVVPALLKAHVDQYVKKDGTVVQAHDDKRQAAAPKQVHSDDAFDQIKAAGGSNPTTSSGAINYYHNGKPKSLPHKDAPDGHRYVDHGELQRHLSDLKSSAAKPAAAAGGTTNRQAALDAYAEKRKLAGQHGQAALDAAEKARNSNDPAHAAEAISAVEKGWNAHKEAAKAARAIPYPGSKSPWEHHDERTSALSKMSEEMHQLHQKLSKTAKPAKPSGSPYAAARGEVMMSVGKDYKPAAKKMLDSMEAGGDHAEEFGKYHFGASHEIVKKTLQKHGIDVGGGSKPAGPKPGHMDVSTLAAGHHLFDKNGQKVDEVESVEKHPMGGLKVNTRAGYSHMVGKDGRNDHGLTNKAPGGSAKPRVLVRKP